MINTTPSTHTVKIVSVESKYYAHEGNIAELTIEVFFKEPDPENEGQFVEKSLGLRKFAYPLDVTEETLKADAQRYRETLDSDHQIGLESSKLMAGHENVDNLHKSLTGQQL